MWYAQVHNTHTLFKFHVLFSVFGLTDLVFSWIDSINTSLHSLMYIRFVLYTCMLQLFKQTYFDMPIHVFGVLCFNKTYFWIYSQKHWYISLYVYWSISIYMPKSCFNIKFLYLDEFWTKRIFIWKIQVLENTGFGFRQNFHNTKMVQISWNMCWNFSHMFVFQREC